MHDDWVYTGGCHVKYECQNYKNICGNCPVLESSQKYDLSFFGWKRKSNLISKIANKTVFVAVSNWQLDCAVNSSILGCCQVVTIANAINTSIYKPCDKSDARVAWSLPLNKKIILFGANSPTIDRNKGFTELCIAIKHLDRSDVQLVVFGSSEPKEPLDLGFPIHYVGHLHDDVSLSVLYSAADVMLVPSKQESFGQTACESMACGTPVVAFATSGLLDIVDHKVNGYLASQYVALYQKLINEAKAV
jgi:glycosyltransferase involved in cell wall biosynthesis